jgi:hypothetical protein
LAQGAVVSASQRLRNTGASIWSVSETYQLNVENHSALAFNPSARTVAWNILPGGAHAFSFEITAPLTPGVHSFSLRMKNTHGEVFGETCTHTITVGETPTAPPGSTATRTPTPTRTAISPSPTATRTAPPAATATRTSPPAATVTATPPPQATATATPIPAATSTPTPLPPPSATPTPAGPPSATPSPGPTPQPTLLTNIFFNHESTGRNLIREGNVRGLFTGLGYSFWDHDYNSFGLRLPNGDRAYYNYNIPGDTTTPDSYAAIFSQPLYTDPQHPQPPVNAFSGFMRHEVILFKSCFTAGPITSDQMLADWQNDYLAIRNRIDQHPERLFILLTTPPRHSCQTAPEYSARERFLADWLKSAEFLSGHPNLVVFDFFDLLAESDPASPNYNTLRTEYRRPDCDSHPNTLANETIGPLLVNFVDAAIHAFTGIP